MTNPEHRMQIIIWKVAQTEDIEVPTEAVVFTDGLVSIDWVKANHNITRISTQLSNCPYVLVDDKGDYWLTNEEKAVGSKLTRERRITRVIITQDLFVDKEGD